MKAIGYSRTSTDKQENSASAQEHRIRAQASLKDMELVEIIDDSDKFSGNLDRPGMKRLLEMVRGGTVDAVIVTKLDRLTRSTKDAIDLMELFSKKNVALISISESLDTLSPIGRCVLRIIASFAELERETIGARTKEGLHNIKRQGFPAGTAPYGYMSQARTNEDRKLKIRKRLAINTTEQEIIARIKELREKRFSYDSIAQNLNEAGYKTRSSREFPDGGKWVTSSVQRIAKKFARV
jgi:site-specific DNA recombinase